MPLLNSLCFTCLIIRSDNLIFILSDTVFDSYWCKEELMTAIKSGVNIILVVKEGSKWMDQDGRVGSAYWLSLKSQELPIFCAVRHHHYYNHHHNHHEEWQPSPVTNSNPASA